VYSVIDKIKMKIILALAFRLLFRIKFFRKRYFGVHKKLFKPYNLFRGVIRKIKYKDLQVILHIDDFIQESLYFTGKYEAAELKAIEQFLKNDSVFIDIGANIGLYTLYASKLINKNGQIISFEPFPKNFQSLTQNITLNGLSNVRIEKVAIGENEGNVNLYYNEREKNLGMVSTTPLEKGIKEEVEVVSLDSYLKNESFTRIDLIKIDIEGFEYPALLGMKETLATFHPTLLIEILDGNESINQISKCDTLLKEFGYNKYFIDDNGNLSKNEVNDNRMNYIFTTQPFTNLK